jgi:hypothetical protein
MATITIITWTFGIFWLRHPLSNDALIVKIKSNLIAKAPFLKILLPKNN